MVALRQPFTTDHSQRTNLMQASTRRMHPLACLTFLGLCVFGSGPLGRAAEEPAAKAAISVLPVIPAEIHQALQDRDFAKAVELMDAAITKPKAPVDYLLYQKGRAQ